MITRSEERKTVPATFLSRVTKYSRPSSVLIHLPSAGSFDSRSSMGSLCGSSSDAADEVVSGGSGGTARGVF